MSAPCQGQTKCVAAKISLFDYIVADDSGKFGNTSATGGGIGRVARQRPLTSAMQEALRHYRLAIHPFAGLFPDAALAVD